jgi:hypothetical protein
MKNITLIDADSLAYLGKTTDTLLQIIEKVDDKIQDILNETNANYYCLFISQGRYFRHNLKDSSEEFGSYKSKRKYDSQIYKKVIKEYLIAEWGSISSPNVEADDLIAYWMNKPLYLNSLVGGKKVIDTYVPDSSVLESSEEVNKILAAVDKDLLQSIPGKHLNYSKKLGADEWGMEWVETSRADAFNFQRKQLIIGDASDGVSGIPGKGEKYWEKMLATMRNGLDSILIEYLVHYGQSQGIYEFQKNYRLLHLLDCDEDYLREVGYIPTLPNFKEVIKQNIEIKNEF